MIGVFERRKGFACITFLHLHYQNANRVVSCCSECPSRLLLTFYCTSSVSDEPAPPFQSSSICGCPHVNAVIMTCVDPRLPKDDSFPYQAQRCLSTAMIEPSAMASGWFSLNKMHSKGQLMLFVSESHETNVFAVTYDEPNDATAMYCFQCTKSNCRHRTLATSDEQGTGQLHLLLEKCEQPTTRPKTIRITPVLASILSTQRYPCTI